MPKIPTSEQFNGQDQATPDQAQSSSQPGHADGAGFDADHAERTALVNEAWVKNAQSSWLDGMNTLMYHPQTGFLNQRGGTAVGGYGSLQDAMGKLYQQSTDNLADDNQRGMFERNTAPLLGAFQAQIRQHADNQCRIFDADASHGRYLSALNLALNAFNPGTAADNTLYRSSAAIAHNELENSFRHTHGDPEAADNKTLWEHYLQFGPNGDGGMCAIHTGIVNRLLENNQPDDARAYFDDIKSSLPASTSDKLHQFICTGEDRQQALNAVLQAQAKGEDHADQHKALDGMRDDGKLSDAAHAIASQSLKAAQQQQLAVQKQNDEESISRVWDIKRANPNAALTDLPASTLAYLKSRGLDTNAEAILSGHPATDDPALFNRLHRLASSDPVKFAQTSLIASSGQLSKAHMDCLQGLQDAVNKQDPQAIQASKQVNDAIDTVHSEMHLSGLDPNPEPGSEQAGKLAVLESGLRDQIIAAQQAKNGTPLTRDEVQNLAMGYFSDQVLKGGVTGKDGDEKQHQDQGRQQGVTETDGIKPDGGEGEGVPATEKSVAPKQAPSSGVNDPASDADNNYWGPQQVEVNGDWKFEHAGLKKEIQSHRPDYTGIGDAYEAIRNVWYKKGDEHETSSQRVVDAIGGQLKKEHDKGFLGQVGNANTCSIRVSYALNRGGDPIDPKVAEEAGIPRNRLYKGGDGKLYLISVPELISYLKTKYGDPSDRGKNSDSSGGGEKWGGIAGMRKRIAGRKGIFIYSGDLHGATGHATLWDGKDIVQEGGPYSEKPGMSGYFWELPEGENKDSQTPEENRGANI